MFKDDNEDEDSGTNTVHYPCMPSLVALQQMRNRLQLATLGRKLMKWSALATGRELRRLATDINQFTYLTFHEDLQNAFILLARARYFYPNLNVMVLNNIENQASIKLTTSEKSVSGVRILEFAIIQAEQEPYQHMGIEKGGSIIQEAKTAWRELLLGMINMLQLRTSFATVDFAFRSANNRMNVLTKVVIPRTKLSIIYVIQELEEQQREEKNRMKMIVKKKKELRERLLRVKAKEEEVAKLESIEPDGTCEKCTNTTCLKYVENLANSMEPRPQQVSPLPCLKKSISISCKKPPEEIKLIEVRIGSKEIIIKSSFGTNEKDHELSCPSCRQQLEEQSNVVKQKQIKGLSSQTINSQPSTSLRETTSNSVSYILNVIKDTLDNIVAYCKNVIISGFNLIDVGQLIILCEDALERIHNLFIAKPINDDTLNLKIDKAKICLHEIIKASSIFGKLVFKSENSEKLLETYEVYERKLLKCCKEISVIKNDINVSSAATALSGPKVHLKAIECKNHNLESRSTCSQSKTYGKRCSKDQNGDSETCEKMTNKVQNKHSNEFGNNNDMKSRLSCTNTTCEKRLNKVQDIDCKILEKNNNIVSRSSDTHTRHKINNIVQNADCRVFKDGSLLPSQTRKVKLATSKVVMPSIKLPTKKNLQSWKPEVNKSDEHNTQTIDLRKPCCVDKAAGELCIGFIKSLISKSDLRLEGHIDTNLSESETKPCTKSSSKADETLRQNDIKRMEGAPKTCCVKSLLSTFNILAENTVNTNAVLTNSCTRKVSNANDCVKLLPLTSRHSFITIRTLDSPMDCNTNKGNIKSNATKCNCQTSNVCNSKTVLNEAKDSTHSSKSVANPSKNCEKSLPTTCHHSVITIRTISSTSCAVNSKPVPTEAKVSNNNSKTVAYTNEDNTQRYQSRCNCPGTCCVNSKTVPAEATDSTHNHSNAVDNAIVDRVKSLPVTCRHSDITIRTLSSQIDTNTTENNMKSNPTKCNCQTTKAGNAKTVPSKEKDCNRHSKTVAYTNEDNTQSNPSKCNYPKSCCINSKTVPTEAKDSTPKSKTVNIATVDCMKSLPITCHHSVITISTLGSQIDTNTYEDNMKHNPTECNCQKDDTISSKTVPSEPHYLKSNSYNSKATNEDNTQSNPGKCNYPRSCCINSKTIPTEARDSTPKSKTVNIAADGCVKSVPTTCHHSVIKLSTLGSQTVSDTNNEGDMKSKRSLCNCQTSGTVNSKTVNNPDKDTRGLKYLQSTGTCSTNSTSDFETVTPTNKERIMKLLGHINVVLETTELCREEGLLSPSAEHFIESCQNMQSTLTSYIDDKLDCLKQNIVNLEKMAEDFQDLELNPPSIADFLASCKKFEKKVDQYKQKRESPEVGKARALLVKRLTEIVNLSRYSESVGLVTRSIESFITSAEQLKQQIQSKSHQTTSQCIHSCKPNIYFLDSQKCHDDTRQQKLCCGTNKTGNLPESRSSVFKDTADGAPICCKELDAEVEINETEVQPTCDSNMGLVQLNICTDGNPKKSNDHMLVLFKKGKCDSCREVNIENQGEAVTDESDIDDIKEHTITRVIRTKNKDGTFTEELQNLTLAKKQKNDKDDGCGNYENESLFHQSGDEDSQGMQKADRTKTACRLTQSHPNTQVPPSCKPLVRVCVSLDSNGLK